jgi:diguanylate cyclase (GGDEF)-like protein
MTQPPDEPLEAATNGRVHRPRVARLQESGAEADQQSRSESEQTLADGEQTLADGDQTLADTDQTSADRDQANADSEQLAADQDQVASDRELAAGGKLGVHDASRDVRQRTSLLREKVADDRDQTAQRRLEVAGRRDAMADTRDLAALARDQAAAARDLAMAQLHTANERAAGPRAITDTEIVLRAADQRRRAAEYRAKAAEHRVLATEDREIAARDREQAARERREALTDREALARALATAAIDELTGARTRAPGLADLEHEIDRCRRISGSLVVAYVDVVGLKTLNDTEGHTAGDELLKHVIALIRDHLRSYDLIIRVGGDEFVCAMSNMRLGDARSRLSDVVRELASAPRRGAIRTGFAELTLSETAMELIARADRQLLHPRNPARIHD